MSKLSLSKASLQAHIKKHLTLQFKNYKAFLITILTLTLILVTAYANPIIVAYPVKLSSDLSAILVKQETRTYLDYLPEYLTTYLKVPANLSKDPYQKQAMLNSYGAALNIMGIKTHPGVLLLKSTTLPINQVLTQNPNFQAASSKESSLANPDKYLYLNNTSYPLISVPALLTLSGGNSDTVALTLYFLEVLLEGNWSKKHNLKITGALNDSNDLSHITRIGSLEQKTKINLQASLLIAPLANKNDNITLPPNTLLTSNLKELISNLCSRPDHGTICSKRIITKYLSSP